MMLEVADGLIYGLVTFNILLCLIIILWDVYFYFKVDEKEKWAKILYIFTAFGWLLRSVLFFFNYDGLGISTINPPLLMLSTFTLLSLALGSIIRVQRITGIQSLRNDIKKLLKKVFSWTSPN